MARRAHTVHHTQGDKYAYIIGGLAFNHLKFSEKFDVHNYKCFNLGILQKARAWPGTLMIDKKLYVFGGAVFGDSKQITYHTYQKGIERHSLLPNGNF